MADTLQKVAARVKEKLDSVVTNIIEHVGELTLEVTRDEVGNVCRFLRDDPACKFEQLIDLCGIDYLDYRKEAPGSEHPRPRFAVVYHLLSITHNHRVRVRTFLNDDMPSVVSVVDIWNSANWYEREAFDLFGIVFEGHPDLRRILTDYGFIGHPFRKDFPLSGHVEMRYDETKRRVVYEPVTIEPRIGVPRTIREEEYSGRDS